MRTLCTTSSCPAGTGVPRPLSPLQLLLRPKPIRVPSKPDISANAPKVPDQALFSSPKPAQPPATEYHPSPGGSSVPPQTNSVPPGTSSVPPAAARKGRAHRRTASEVPSSGVPPRQQVGRPCRLHWDGTSVCEMPGTCGPGWSSSGRQISVESSSCTPGLHRGQPVQC